MQYDWPGNVRELENIIERSMIVSQGDTLVIDASWLSGNSEPSNIKPLVGNHPSLAEMECRVILDALSRAGGKVYGHDGAAAELNVIPTTLYSKMRKHNIKGSRKHNSSE